MTRAYPGPRRWDAPPRLTAPTAVIEVELSAEAPRFPSARAVQALIRLHGHPMGILRLSGADIAGGLGTLREKIEYDLGPAVREHLAADGVAVPPGPLAAILPSSDACRRTAPKDFGVSVVVNACEASPELVRALASIQAQTRLPDELIVVDNRPTTSGIPGLLKELELGSVTYVPEPVKGLARARNTGLAVASGELVAFTDDDVIADPSWLEVLVSGFEDENVAAVTGLILPAELETEPQILFEEFGGFNKGYERRRFDLHLNRPENPLFPFSAGMFGSGANAAFRASLLRRLGGFDVSLGTGTPSRGGEDLDIFLTVIQAGEAIVYEPGAIMWHSHHRGYRDLRRQMHNYGVGLGAMMAKRVLTSRAERRELLRLAPECARYLLDPRSPKNEKKNPAYPRSLTLLELVGVVRGPFAYLASRRSS
ncbi:glycosyltransferase family 2 protein [Pseudofrankia saprophytica]|uniref:glycosyltransferase family 2 protein n=1 Tax=Pseudofrankia saprophytica TaxID=298655 RepID=UPI000234BF1D|nr:glycosyltransferase family 2 protein [Pseudofrankia saprophytica]